MSNRCMIELSVCRAVLYIDVRIYRINRAETWCMNNSTYYVPLLYLAALLHLLSMHKYSAVYCTTLPLSALHVSACTLLANAHWWQLKKASLLSAVMAAQAFAGGQQPPGGIAYPPRQDPLDSRLPYNPHASRTPGRGNMRTPFSSTSQARLSQPPSQSAAVTQAPSESGLSSQVAMTADSSADATPATEVITNLEALSLTDSVSAQRLSPIVTHPALSPSNVILASTARSTAPEGQQQPVATTAVAQDSPVPQEALHLLESAPLPVTDGF